MRTILVLTIWSCSAVSGGCGDFGPGGGALGALDADGDGTPDLFPGSGGDGTGGAPAPDATTNGDVAAPEPDPGQSGADPGEPDPGPPPEPLPGDPAAGASLFKFNCQHCHGVDGRAGTASDIRGASAVQVAGAVAGNNRHDEFPGLSPGDIDNLTAFLAISADG